ncbi:GNAT family acetyltransferase [Sphingomonas crusticola]|uniref:GNAT family acetyltransferase n=1 Tax=Sphingomonas crusticola TaxID=1697973 RepID=UPI000E28099A|nr:GNAT family acetyltransferase [Sphingomonas crusticola]
MTRAAAADPEIGTLSPDDVEQAIELWAEAGVSHPWNDAHADIAAALACPTGTILAARAAGRIVATVMAGYDGHRGWLYYVAVANSHRGTGLGRAIVTAAEDWLRGQGAHVIRLMVRRSNEQAVGFYEALGFEAGDLIVMGKRFGAG